MIRSTLALALAAALGAAPAAAEPFTYHGDLMDGDAPAEGAYDLRFRAFASPEAKSALGEATELPGVKVVDGSFAVELDLPENRNGATYVEVAVRKAGSNDAYETLGTAQPILKANTGCWALDGNTGVPAGSFIGIADPANSSPVDLRSRNVRVARFSPGDAAGANAGAGITLLGSAANVAVVRGATVSGGGATHDAAGAACPSCANTAAAVFSTVGGGVKNYAAGDHSVISGGNGNTIVGNGDLATVGGGASNNASNLAATVGGGESNTASGIRTTVAGGEGNIAGPGYAATVGGGDGNEALAERSTVGGGASNQAIGDYSTVPGGLGNCAGGDESFAGGSGAFVRSGNEPGEVVCGVPGSPTSGDANGDEGSFVWSGTVGGPYITTGPNQFIIGADGGVSINNPPFPTDIPGFGTITPELTIDAPVNDDGMALVTLKRGTSEGHVFVRTDSHFTIEAGQGDLLLYTAAAGRYIRTNDRLGVSRPPSANMLEVDGNASKAVAGDWLANSDRRIKTGIEPIANALDTVMKLRPVTFRYDEDYRRDHGGLGPQRYYNVIAQEFAEVFPEAVQGSGEYLPGKPKSRENEILQVDTYPAQITAIAAIQELAVQDDELQAELAAVKRQNAQLRKRLDAVLTRLERLENGGGN